MTNLRRAAGALTDSSDSLTIFPLFSTGMIGFI